MNAAMTKRIFDEYDIGAATVCAIINIMTHMEKRRCPVLFVITE